MSEQNRIHHKTEQGFTCCICGKHIVGEWGNDPYPIREEGECCDKCNNEKVIPARLKDWRY